MKFDENGQLFFDDYIGDLGNISFGSISDYGYIVIQVSGNYYYVPLSDFLTMVDSTSKTADKVNSDIISLVDGLSKNTHFTLSSIFSLNDAYSTKSLKYFYESFQLSLEKSFSSTKSLGEFVLFDDNVFKDMSKLFSESASFVDDFFGLFAKQVMLTDILYVNDICVKHIEKNIYSSIVFYDHIKKGLYYYAQEIISLSDYDSRYIYKSIYDFFVLSEICLHYAEISLLFYESLSFSDYKKLYTYKNLESILAFSDEIGFGVSKVFVEVVSFIDNYSFKFLVKCLYESVSLVERVFKDATREFYEAMYLSSLFGTFRVIEFGESIEFFDENVREHFIKYLFSAMMPVILSWVNLLKYHGHVFEDYSKVVSEDDDVLLSSNAPTVNVATSKNEPVIDSHKDTVKVYSSHEVPVISAKKPNPESSSDFD